MVSKIIKITPTKKCRDRRSGNRRRKTPSPLKRTIKASIIISSINQSFCTCKRRLIKIFTKFANLGTPTGRKHGFHRLCKIADDNAFAPTSPIPQKPLPPLEFPEKKTVFLDLDETLVHSKSGPPPEKYDFVVKPNIEGEVLDFYVLKRPGVDELLEEMGKDFEIVVFTAGLREYASLVLDKLDPKGLISHRLYRDSCTAMEGKLVKDLSSLGRDLSRAVIIDDNPNAYSLHPENAVPVAPFIDDLGDKELQRIIDFLNIAKCFDDMRDAITYYLP